MWAEKGSLLWYEEIQVNHAVKLCSKVILFVKQLRIISYSSNNYDWHSLRSLSRFLVCIYCKLLNKGKNGNARKAKANVGNASIHQIRLSLRVWLDTYFLWCCFCMAASDIWPCRINLRCLSTSPSIRAKAWFPTWPRSDSKLSSSESSTQTDDNWLSTYNVL